MPKLISKVQHKNYETGEFTNEQPRDLNETIALIKAFPWEDERHLTDIQLTGPSVTICNKVGEYLKIGLYFNEKFCAYFLDSSHTLYECPMKNLEDVYKTVTVFFDAELSLKNFDKQLINFNNKKHFETNSFEYTPSFSRFIKVNAFLIMYVILFGTLLFKDTPVPMLLLMPLLLVCLPGAVIIYTAIKTYLQRTKYLKISRANKLFLIGNSVHTAIQYNKDDIEQVRTYKAKGYRNPILIVAIEIIFKDKHIIKFSNLLIGYGDFCTKFPDHIKLFKDGNKHPLKRL